ncbi:alpha/beta hydrolase [Roseovarius sp. ZX-A-9]|uniref:alpha/beta hydrolase n=1 Tax=Roseovarius sp. ZX-A-9 TaxID=3014783 RepID=UPI00232B41EF|nr:alpha/beta fold hydrolase [Roseovarius sp. ZX-A-9]
MAVPIGSIVRTLVFSFSIVSASTSVAQTDNGSVELAIQQELTAPGPEGSLAGTLTLPVGDGAISDEAPVVLIVPGSGPTDRNGNSPLGISAAPYALLAEALAEQGIPSLRIDKRGMFGSMSAIPDPNDVTITAYGDDLLAWTQAIRDRLPRTDGGTRCIVPLGHSEGGLVALVAIARLPNPCGLILVSTPGRPLGTVLREQLHANPANAPILSEADEAIMALERGERVDVSAFHPALQPLFAPVVQGFLIDAFAYDPAALMAQTRVPVLIIQGLRDLQVGETDARRLADAAPEATLSFAPDVNHVLKVVSSDDTATNYAAYADPDLPIAQDVVEAVAHFLEQFDE